MHVWMDGRMEGWMDDGRMCIYMCAAFLGVNLH